MAMDVRGKTAIVTGAGSGINLCFAKLLLEKGCNVVFADLALRPEAQTLVSQYTNKTSGAKAIFQKTDVTDWAQLDKMFEVAIKHFGGADIVCPGAGVFEPVRPLDPPQCCANLLLFYSHGQTSGIHQEHLFRKTKPPSLGTPSWI
jgi:NAD(P)-dependent dehydrogenase (short-subunit alcohol dehydrogenase family)